METMTLVVSSAPYGDEKVWNAFRLARALISVAVKMRVNLFLVGDAVVAAKRGQKTPDGYPNLEKMLWELIEKGVEVVACSTCTSARGLGEEDIIEGVQVGTIMQLAHWLKETEGVLSF